MDDDWLLVNELRRRGTANVDAPEESRLANLD
jgi:hypothetical protein